MTIPTLYETDQYYILINMYLTHLVYFFSLVAAVKRRFVTSRLSGIIRDMRDMLQDIYIVTVLQLLWLYTHSMSPLALEAAIGLLNLGVALSEVLFISRSLHCGEEFGVLTPGTW